MEAAVARPDLGVELLGQAEIGTVVGRDLPLQGERKHTNRVDGDQPDPGGDEIAQPCFGLSPGQASASRRADHAVREFKDEKERPDEVQPAMDQKVVPDCESLVDGLFVFQLPLEDHRRIDNNRP